MALLKPCPKCKRMIPYGWTYCPDCKPIAEAERQAAMERRIEYKRKAYNRRYNQGRDPKYTRFYNSKAWRATSYAKLSACDWQCEAHLTPDCQGTACEVHHIKPIQTPAGWDLRLDWSNLEAVCTSCHNVRHPEKLKRKEDDGIIDMRTVKR